MESLTPDERERIADSALKIQSVRESLTKVSRNKITGMTDINECLTSVDRHLRTALGYAGPRDVVKEI